MCVCVRFVVVGGGRGRVGVVAPYATGNYRFHLMFPSGFGIYFHMWTIRVPGDIPMTFR